MANALKPNIHQFQDNLYLISLPVPIRGFEGFIGAWLYDADPLILVDVGPAVSANQLIRAVSQLGLGPPEVVLLTHIHIDHAGAIGMITDAYPQAKVVCHPKGVRHLIDPEKLWQGSLATLGHIAKAYAPIAKAAPDQLIACDAFAHEGITCIETPGHAAHHVSYIIDDLLFAGEAGGVCLPLRDRQFYLRPATPPRFFMETTLESIDRLIAESPDKICYGHIGKQDDAAKMLMTHRRQLLDWYEMIQPFFLEAKEDETAMNACAEHLLANDPLLKSFSDFPSDVQQRERNFIANSIKGYWGYLSANASASE